jgi:hypothetical protein
LHQIIGHPNGLVIYTDTCKGLKIVVDDVFPGVGHRECMRHLAANLSKSKHKGKLIDDNLWSASLESVVHKVRCEGIHGKESQEAMG